MSSVVEPINWVFSHQKGFQLEPFFKETNSSWVSNDILKKNPVPSTGTVYLNIKPLKGSRYEEENKMTSDLGSLRVHNLHKIKKGSISKEKHGRGEPLRFPPEAQP